MRRLLTLYPRAWRERYGEEFEGLLEQERITPLLLLNVVGGALDARIRLRRLGAPPLVAVAAVQLRGVSMLSSSRFRKVGIYTGIGVFAAAMLVLFVAAVVYAVNLANDLFHRDRSIFDAVVILTIAIVISGLLSSGSSSSAKANRGGGA